jgi:hypothetical protein
MVPYRMYDDDIRGIPSWVSWTLFLMLWKLITIALNDFNGLFGSLCFVLRFGDDEAIGLPNDVVEWHELSITDVV